MTLKKQYSLTLLLLWFIPIVMYAQTAPPVVEVKSKVDYTKQKAIAYNLEKHMSPVPNYYSDWNSLISINQSGDGVVNIPVFEIKGRKLSLPISVNYITNGIKAEQKSSEVGLGWTINFGSIVRDYGAFEPDYTYTGSEFKMQSWNNPNNNLYDRQLHTSNGAIIDPLAHNKNLEYTSVQSGIAPDEYIINVPGMKSNSFWNKNANGQASNTVNFIFTQPTPMKIEYTTDIFSHNQEISRVNEVDLVAQPSGSAYVLDNAHNYAAAIGFYPYVKNHNFSRATEGIDDPVSMVLTPTVSYEDYNKFSISTTDGTQYVFGKPLKAQKYLIDEEPFWSTFNVRAYKVANIVFPSSKHCYGEFWKTEYIAEWMLTEVHSSDYIDANNNGAADDGDSGDWIKIEYTDPKKEWLNITQTDKASSLWRERAYITHITTPLQKIDVTSLRKFDIDFDYSNSIFNTGSGNYDYYHAQNTSGISNLHECEERYYTDFTINDKITTGYPIINDISFQYPLQGSSSQLCVSNYMIASSNGGTINFTSYDPESCGQELIDSRFYNPQYKRGKTTLKGITIEGNIANSQNAITYKFNYGKNPSYDNLHLYQIKKQIAFPAVRESSVIPDNEIRWANTLKTITTSSPATILPIANSILPWKWLQVDYNKNITWGENTTAGNSGGIQTIQSHPVMSDEMGYIPNVDPVTLQPAFNRDAWSLSEIELPYGGVVKITYENDQFDITTDRQSWKNDGIADYCIPSIGHYNNIAHMRSIQQDFVNANEGCDKKLYREYYYLMNQYSGGLRVKSIEYDDKYNSPIIKNYTYGIGHYSAPPADYWQNYLKGLSAFTYDESSRRYSIEQFVGHKDNTGYNEFFESMLRLMTGIRIDNSISKMASHYYEYVDEALGTGSATHTRYYYGTYIPNPSPSVPVEKKHLAYHKTDDVAIKGEYMDRYNFVELMFNDLDNSKQIGNYKTEYYQSNTLQKTESLEYEFTEVDNNTITTKEEDLVSSSYSPYAKFLDAVNNWAFDNAYMTAPSEEVGTNSWSNPEGNHSKFFEPLTYGNNFYVGLGYKTNNSIRTVVNHIVEAQNPLPATGFSCGLYTNQPGWFQSITNTSNSWSTILTPTQMASTFYNAIHLHMAQSMYSHYQGSLPAVQVRFYNDYKDENYLVPAGNVKTQQSYLLRPTSITTTLKY